MDSKRARFLIGKRLTGFGLRKAGMFDAQNHVAPALINVNGVEPFNNWKEAEDIVGCAGVDVIAIS